MPRTLRYLFATLIAALLVAGPVGYAWYQQAQFRNLHVVVDGVLYRSGQLSLSGLKRVLHDHHIKTVISLRDSYSPGYEPPDLDEERFCKAEELNYVRIPPRTWWASDGTVPADQGVRRFLDLMRDPANHPVLVHCFAGIHRTGAHVAVYRMEFEHWNNARAIAELKALGYDNLGEEWDLLTYLEQYHPTWQPGREPPRPREAHKKVQSAEKRKRKKRTKV
jgi:predicted protein tyrosine phosphatase